MKEVYINTNTLLPVKDDTIAKSFDAIGKEIVGVKKLMLSDEDYFAFMDHVRNTKFWNSLIKAKLEDQ